MWSLTYDGFAAPEFRGSTEHTRHLLLRNRRRQGNVVKAVSKLRAQPERWLVWWLVDVGVSVQELFKVFLLQVRWIEQWKPLSTLLLPGL